MNPETLTLEDILPFLNSLLDRKGYPALDSAQIACIRASWEGIDYKDMAGRSPYSWGKLHRVVAPPLWKMLADAMGCSVSKRTLRRALEHFIASDRAGSPSTDLSVKDRRIIGKVPNLEGFIGRKSELRLLEKYIIDKRCVYLSGSAGVGKTSLMAELFNKIKVDSKIKYDLYLWKYSTTSSPTQDIAELSQILNVPSGQTFTNFIRENKSFICIDGIERWLYSHESETEEFIRQITDSEHDSCVVLTSREPMLFIKMLKQKGRSIESMNLSGLSNEDSKEIMNRYGLPKKSIETLTKSYAGNPMLIHSACGRMQGLSQENLEKFINHGTSMAEDFYFSNYDELFKSSKQLKESELLILSYLARVVGKESIEKNKLITEVLDISTYRFPEILNTIETLIEYSLVLSIASKGGEMISLPHDLIKYIQRDPLNIFPSTNLQKLVG